MLLDDDSKVFTTINTHKGLFQYNRLPYGVSSAPGIFQRTMENLLQGIQRVLVRLDDILITGEDDDKHLDILDQVCSRLSKAGVRLKRGKCFFMVDEVVFLGHRINKEGIHPVDDKIQAIRDAPSPRSITELKSYLGLLNYYSKFLRNLSPVLAPLHELLRKSVKWHWGKEQEDAFSQSKELLQSSAVLIHFDPSKPLVLDCDASPYGIGAVLSHKMANETERPIDFMSRTLSRAEKGYSQLEKEALSIVFGVKKFHKFLNGRHFTVKSDHKPLLGLLKETKGIPAMTAVRIQRWALTLSAYEYELVHKSGKLHANADALSRLPLPDSEGGENPPIPGENILLMEHLDNQGPVTCKQIKTWTQRDSGVVQSVQICTSRLVGEMPGC